jgi:hypothetical protein
MATKDITKNENGSAVRVLQEQLLLLGYHLPRWGADGGMGDETLAAVEAFKRDRQIGAPTDDLPSSVPGPVIDAIAAAAKKVTDGIGSTPMLVDLTNAHQGAHRIRKRGWDQVTGITLHQTATVLGEKRERWFNIPVQLGVTRGGQVLVLNGCEWVTWHGNGLNTADVGIEIDGYYEGVEGDIRTFWRPQEDPNRVPLTPTAVQIAAARMAVTWICDEVARHGGAIKFIHAHRQASDERQSDPGSRLWKEVGLWAQQTRGLSDGGKDFTLGTGLKIPEAWDPSRAGIRY